MNSKIANVLRKLRILADLPGKMPGNLFVEAASLGESVGMIAAEHQLDVGFLGQSGSYGGGPWSPENVEYEMQYIRGIRVF